MGWSPIAWGDRPPSRCALPSFALRAGLVPPRIDDAFAKQRRLAALLDAEWSRFGFALYLDRADGRFRLGFGAHCGELLGDVDREYLCWCLGEMDDLTDEARGLMQEAAG